MAGRRHAVDRGRRRPVVATCTAVAALVALAACGSEETSTAADGATATEVPGPAPETPDTTPEPETTETTEPAAPEFTPPVRGMNEENPPGRYEFEFADGVLAVEPSEPFAFVSLGDFIVFDDPANPGGGSDYFAFLRVSELPVDDGAVPVSEPQSWIDGSAAVTVEASRTEGMAEVYRVTSDSPTQVHPQFTLFPGELYELWFLEVAGADPLILIGKTTPATPEYLDTLAALVSTVTFRVDGADGCTDRPWECGESGEVPAGDVCLPTLGGITFTMSETRPIQQPIDGIALVVDPDADGFAALAVLAPDETPLGEPITSTEDVVDAQAALFDLEPIDDRTIFGADASGYAFEAEELEPAVFMIGGNAVSPSPFTQFWTVDTDDGPVIVSPAGDSPADLDRALAILEDVGPSLSFADGCPADT